MDDYELNGTPCPNCGYEETRWRYCSNFCNNGYLDESSDTWELDRWIVAIPCPQCRGTSIEVWCPCCGANVSGIRVPEDYLTEKA